MHRDVKSEHLHGGEECMKSTYKLGDFGMAVQVSDDKELMLIAGTEGHLSPEVLKRSHGRPSDVWSCAVVFFLLATGSRLFKVSK